MSAFEIVHQDRVIGKLTCFDRMIFKGQLARFNMPGRLKSFLDHQGVLLKDFDRYVTKTTDAVKAHAQALAATAGRPVPVPGRDPHQEPGPVQGGAGSQHRRA